MRRNRNRGRGYKTYKKGEKGGKKKNWKKELVNSKIKRKKEERKKEETCCQIEIENDEDDMNDGVDDIINNRIR